MTDWQTIVRGEISYSLEGVRPWTATRPFVLLCDLERTGTPIVVVSESRTDGGPSITNAAEQVRKTLINCLRTAGFRLVEHYREAPGFPETFDWVHFDDYGKPVWKPMEIGDRSRAAFARALDGDAMVLAQALDPQEAQQ